MPPPSKSISDIHHCHLFCPCCQEEGHNLEVRFVEVAALHQGIRLVVDHRSPVGCIPLFHRRLRRHNLDLPVVHHRFLVHTLGHTHPSKNLVNRTNLSHLRRIHLAVCPRQFLARRLLVLHLQTRHWYDHHFATGRCYLKHCLPRPC